VRAATAKLTHQRFKPALGEGDDGEIEYGPTSALASAEVAKAYVATVEGSLGVTTSTRAGALPLSRWQIDRSEDGSRSHSYCRGPAPTLACLSSEGFEG
jgi:hypothetical protein